MTVATFQQPKFNDGSQDATTYKGNIDASIKVLSELAANFSPHEAATPDMTVLVDPGKLMNGATHIVKAGQVTGTITAPSSNPRIDRIAIDTTNGNLVVLTGTEAASPVAPDYAANHYPVCWFRLATTTTSIINGTQTATQSEIHDERPLIRVAPPQTPLFVGARVEKSTSLVLTNLVLTAAPFDSEVYDTDSFHDNVTNNHRLTIPSGIGVNYVQLSAGVGWNPNATGYREYLVYKNGTTLIYRRVLVASSLTEQYDSFVTPAIPVTDGDYFELRLRQNSGGDLAVSLNSAGGHFAIMKVG